MAHLFGTDGIRGHADTKLPDEFVYRVGKAFGVTLHRRFSNMSVLSVGIGRDTRLSGERIEQAMIQGMLDVGIHVFQFGIVPSPAISRLVVHFNQVAGIVISASHNPIHDNGIKCFDQAGYKLSSEWEEEIEELLSLPDQKWPQYETKGIVQSMEKDAPDLYASLVASLYPANLLKGCTVAVDLAHGATWYTTPRILQILGAQVISCNETPDGNHINVGCGATHPEFFTQWTRDHSIKYHFGLTHDGDGDRVMMFTDQGTLIDGDMVITFCALHRHSKGNLPGNGVVGTLMTNTGIERFLTENGIRLYRSDVGDKYVLRDLIKFGYTLGGEQSGHVLFLDKVRSGDGIITALEFMQTYIESQGRWMQELEKIRLYSHHLTNIHTDNKQIVMNSSWLKSEVQKIEDAFPNARINIRPSGTEPLVRLLVEAQEKELVTELTDKISALIKSIS